MPLSINGRRKQKGQRIETPTAWLLRFYQDGKQKCIMLAPRNDLYQTWADVEPLIERKLEEINSDTHLVPSTIALADYIEKHYLPFVTQNKAAVTANSYTRLWERYWKPELPETVRLTELRTAHVTKILTRHAQQQLGPRTLSHIKWFLSGVYGHAIASGVATKNPAPDAEWLLAVRRPEKQTEYTLPQVLAMIAVLGDEHIQAAAAIALCYFAALRPCEARGLRWEDWTGEELHVRRSIWRNRIGVTKTEESAASVPVIEPLRILLERLRSQTKGEYILSSRTGQPLSLNALNTRVIAPILKASGIAWAGYYPCRRGISSLVTDTSKNALNSTGLLRHSTPITALKHYTRAQKDSITAALKTVEGLALSAKATT